MQRFNTSLSFDKDILEYENGFDLDKSNFWIGWFLPTYFSMKFY